MLGLWHEYLDKRLESSYTFLVNHENEQVLGFACFGPHALTQGTYDLYWIAVDPDSQGMGIGQALLNQVERCVCDHEGRLLVIETSSNKDYRSARRFYQHNGYRRVTRIPDFYAPGDDLLIYYKPIQRNQANQIDYPVAHMSDYDTQAMASWWERKRIW